MLNNDRLTETCDCDDCLDSESPCSHDCDSGERCRGCHEAAAEAAEWNYEIACAQGIR